MNAFTDYLESCDLLDPEIDNWKSFIKVVKNYFSDSVRNKQFTCTVYSEKHLSFLIGLTRYDISVVDEFKISIKIKTQTVTKLIYQEVWWMAKI